MEQAAIQFGPDVDAAITDAVQGRGVWPLNFEYVRLLRILQEHRGAARPITLRGLVNATEIGERELKAMIRSLVVDFEIPIGASRSDPCGYFLAVNAEERLSAARPYIQEIRKLAMRVKALIGRQAFLEELGQMRL